MRKPRIVCIGNGLAAMQLALNINDDLELVILSSSGFSDTNSFLAKGGIAIPTDENDIEQHIADTIKAGDGLCNEEAVRFIISGARNVVYDLAELGIKFDDSISREGGHSKNRIRHISDETGRFLIQNLYSLVKQKSNVHLVSNCQFLDLIMENGACTGVWYADRNKQLLKSIKADAIVIASGGGANLYKYHTNSFYANAEAISIAYRAGAEISGLEFIQFHPTRLWEKNNIHHLLITEALRGAGAIIKNKFNDEIMKDVHELKSLAPRDIVSRTMFKQMLKSKSEFLHLDIQEVDKKQMERDFPLLDSICLLEGFYFNGYIPVTPAAHYFCGGIQTGLHAQTNIPHLYALGEVANTGLHGANRLASNSLLELFVMAKSLATHFNNFLEPGFEIFDTANHPEFREMPFEFEKFMSNIKDIMWDHFGIIRNHQGMMSGFKLLLELNSDLQNRIAMNGTQLQLIQALNICQSSLIIAESAIQRMESRGAHYREDYPQHQDGIPLRNSFQSHFPELFQMNSIPKPELILEYL